MSTLTKLYPMVQFKKDTWEIDEFDGASMFLLIGSEKAMLIDCGFGIGDLAGAVRMLTDKPLIVALSHNHPDHTGNARQFPEVWMNHKDLGMEIPMDIEHRRNDIRQIARRQKGSIGAPYNLFHLYPYDIETDVREPEEPLPVIHEMRDGQTFNLGGGRIVTAYACPGHTKGEMVFLDSQTHTMIAGDAVNYNLLIGAVPLESALKALKRIQGMGDQYDGIWNGHHDFRALGAPLDPDCLPTIIALMEKAVGGQLLPCECPSFWGQDVPLTRQGETMGSFIHEGGFPGEKKHRIATLRMGRNWLTIDPDLIHETGSEKEKD